MDEQPTLANLTRTRLIPFDEVLAMGRAYRAHFNIKEWGLAAYMHEPHRGHYVFTENLVTEEITGRLAFDGEDASC